MRPTGALLAQVFVPEKPRQRCRLEWRGGRVTTLTPHLLDPQFDAGETTSGLRVLSDDQLVVPAFHDGHTHVFGLGTSRLRPDLGEASSRAEALGRLEAWLSKWPDTTPVIAEGWDESAWPDPTLPTRRDLDRITNRPLALRRECGHVAVFNSAALQQVGTDWADLDPETGLAREALPLSLARLWPPTEEEQQRAVERGQEECLARGVVAIHEMGDPLTYAAFGRLQSQGALRLRVSHFFHSDHLEQALSLPWEGTPQLQPAGIKFFLDGSFGGRSAWLRKPYPNSPEGPQAHPQGISIWEDDAFFAAVDRCFTAGHPVAAHAIGDAAIAQALRAVESLGHEAVPGAGFRIEHAEYLAPDLFSRIESLPVLLSMQPNFVARWQGPGGLYERVLGSERTRLLNPLREAYQLPHTFFGSDCMPLDPLCGLGGATDHPVAAQRLTPAEALAAYTARPARALAQPLATGVLQEGDPADFVVLQRTKKERENGTVHSENNPGSVHKPESVNSPESMHNPGSVHSPGFFSGWTVAETWIDGECVYKSPAGVSVEG